MRRKRRISYNTPNPWSALGKYFMAKEQCQICENYQLTKNPKIKNPIKKCIHGIDRPQNPCEQKIKNLGAKK